MNRIAADTASTAIVTAWISADGQDSLPMAGATVDQARAELLDQCATDEERASIVAGAFVLAEE